jgi:hypothetical protein
MHRRNAMTRRAILALAAAVLAGDEALGRVAGAAIGVVVERDASTASST